LDPLSFFSQTRVFVVTGKGGVGKTTLSGVMANLAARTGLRAVVVQVATASDRLEPETAHLCALFGREEVLGYEEVLLRPRPGEVRARAIRPDSALVEYLQAHGMRRLSRRLASTGALEVVATAVPGMPDMLVLGKVKQMERAAASRGHGAPDVVVLDAPAAGHALRFLQSPHGLVEAATGGPVRAQAREVVEMLTDPARCQVVLVTTPEETPVSETVETAQLLEDRAGTKLCAVVVNARLPVLDLPPWLGPQGAGELAVSSEGFAARSGDAGELAASDGLPPANAPLAGLASASGVILSPGELANLSAALELRRQRQESQAAQVARLAEELPLPQLELPFCFSTELGPAELEGLTDAFAASVGRWEPVGLP
jgi:anion-transporting  ArsA/GET3 family ATPase